MAAQFGTYQLLDTLANNSQSLVEYGFERMQQDLDNLLAAHNAMKRVMVDELCDYTTMVMARYGVSSTMEMERGHEFGQPRPQKMSLGSNVGFPCYTWQIGQQWTRRYLEEATVQDLMIQVKGARDADLKNLLTEVRKTLFAGTNFTTPDHEFNNLGIRQSLGSGVQIPVKALVNADSQDIPSGPNAETFDSSTHTHYLGASTLNAAALDALIGTVIEHFADGRPVVYINRAQESTVRNISGFQALTDARITIADSSNRILSPGLDVINLNNRLIGIYGGAEIWVKPWIPASYLFAYVKGQAKPLMIREWKPGSSNLKVIYRESAFPLSSEGWESIFGVGVYNRTNGAVQYIGDTSYVVPTITTAH